MRARAGAVALVCAAVAWLGGCGQALAADTPPYAPLDQPGPPLTVPGSKLNASLVCEASVTHARVEPVLLNPATGVTAAQNYSWNWEPALSKLGIPWCAYTAPNDTLNDIQVSGEYLVHAIRSEYALAGRKIAVMGHSQGGMSMRWALRFWPDTRAMVADVIGFSGSNHGTTVETTQDCQSVGCPPADWQQIYQSSFIRALNSLAETFPGISYTEIWTHTDEVVQPNGSAATASAAVHGGGGRITDIATQQICPADTYEHLGVGTVDPVAYALAVDALTHDGPADPKRIPSAVCSQVYMPGVNPLNAQTYVQTLAGAPGLISVAIGPLSPYTAGAPVLHSPPGLACYVFARCRGSVAPQLLVADWPRRGRRADVVHVLVRVREGAELVPVPGVRVRLAGRIAVTDSDGDVALRVRLRARQGYAITATRAGCNTGRRVLRALR